MRKTLSNYITIWKLMFLCKLYAVMFSFSRFVFAAILLFKRQIR